LLKEAQCADPARADAATEALITENMGLVRSAARRFLDRGTEYEDLIQIGTIGMLRAIRTFDLSRNTAFSTFAVPLIVGEIRRHLRDDGIIRVSRSYKQLAAELTAAKAKIAAETGREAKLSELAAEMEVFPQVLINVRVSQMGKARYDNDEEIKKAVASAEKELGDSGRVLVRVSGTEPLVRVMLEGKDTDQIERLANTIADVVRARLV